MDPGTKKANVLRLEVEYIESVLTSTMRIKILQQRQTSPIIGVLKD
jgi:hypothetical protein